MVADFNFFIIRNKGQKITFRAKLKRNSQLQRNNLKLATYHINKNEIVVYI